MPCAVNKRTRQNRPPGQIQGDGADLLIQFDADTRLRHDGQLQWIIERRTGKSWHIKRHFCRTRIGLERHLTKNQLQRAEKFFGGEIPELYEPSLYLSLLAGNLRDFTMAAAQ